MASSSRTGMYVQRSSIIIHKDAIFGCIHLLDVDISGIEERIRGRSLWSVAYYGREDALS